MSKTENWYTNYWQDEEQKRFSSNDDEIHIKWDYFSKTTSKFYSYMFLSYSLAILTAI